MSIKDLDKFPYLKRHFRQNNDTSIVDGLVRATGESLSFIQNIVAYAQCLAKPGTTNIDETVFRAQMERRFHVGQSNSQNLLYNAACQLDRPFFVTRKSETPSNLKVNDAKQSITPKKSKKSNVLSLQNYVMLVCVFLSDDIDKKVNLLFDCFDTNFHGSFSTRELTKIVAWSVSYHGQGDEHENHNEATADIVNLLFAKFDHNQDGTIDRKEFRTVLRKDTLLMDCLGHVLPDSTTCCEFRALVSGRLPLEVRAYFRRERAHSLLSHYERETAIFEELYPIRLENWL